MDKNRLNDILENWVDVLNWLLLKEPMCSGICVLIIQQYLNGGGRCHKHVDSPKYLSIGAVERNFLENWLSREFVKDKLIKGSMEHHVAPVWPFEDIKSRISWIEKKQDELF